MGVQRVLRGAPAKIEVLLRDQNGEPRNATGAVTIGVTRADGTVLVAPGTATVDEPEVGRYSYQLSISQTALLDELAATWSADGAVYDTTVEVVGAFYFGPSDVRNSSTSLADVNRFPDQTIINARQAIETQWENWCNRAFVQRYRRLRLSGDSTDLLLADVDIRLVRSLSVDGVALTQAQIDLLVIEDWGFLRNAYGTFASLPGGVVIGYEHGNKDNAPPSDVYKATLAHLRMVLLEDRSAVPARTETLSVTDGGTFRLSVPGERDALTGVAWIDEIARRYRVHVPAIA